MASDLTAPTPGKIVELADGLRRILAPNPSPMTYWGTNTYVLGTQKLVIIDPGPDLEPHIAAIGRAVEDGTVHAVFVTHSHLDHSQAARKIGSMTGAPVLAYGDSSAGRSETMKKLATAGLTGGGEGIDKNFEPGRTVTDGEVFASNEWQLEIVHTPGHMGNHISIRWADAIFSGDLVMGWASSLVSPPDGDLGDFLNSCEKLRAMKPRILFPGHGAPVDDALARIDWLIGHRKDRSAEILAELAVADKKIKDLVTKLYHDTPKQLHPAAERNLFAHLIHLTDRGLVSAKPVLSASATYKLTS